MKNFSEFKKSLGYSCKELEKITGYTRQGLHYSFELAVNGVKPNRKFVACLDKAVAKKIEEETATFNKRLEELRKLQEEVNSFNDIGKVIIEEV